MNNSGIVVIRLQYQRRPESGEAGFNEDTTSFPLRAAVRICEAFKPKFSEPFRLLRGLTNSARASIHACQQSFCCFRVRFHLSAPSVALAFHEQEPTAKERQGVGKEQQELVKARQGNE